jgi:hypothetical protein
MEKKHFKNLTDLYELDIYLAFNIAANQANLEIEEHHIRQLCYYMVYILRDARRNPEYYYLACIEKVLENEREQFKEFFHGCV